MSEAYKEAGVNLELGDALSEMLFRAAEQTWPIRQGRFGELTVDSDSFFAGRSMSILPLLQVPKPEGIRMTMGDDGVGTKVEVAQRVGHNNTVAYDLFAMVVDDAAIKGYEPVAVSTTLDVARLNEGVRGQMEELAKGYWQAAQKAGVVIVNGETAELGKLVGGYEGALNYNWSATALSVGHADRILTGELVRPGQPLVGFREHGFRSNGLSLVRKIMEQHFGLEWHKEHIEDLPLALGEMVLTPSIIYSPVLVDVIGGYDLRNESTAHIAGAAHITGGGIPGKLGRMLKPSGHGANISHPFTPPRLMTHLAGLQGIPDDEIYCVWNMGQGMIVASEEPEILIERAAAHGVEAMIVGEVTESPQILIRSAGNQPGSTLIYEPHS
jgi:phosphoribosylformylglycinamidine cyclo-ligase